MAQITLIRHGQANTEARDELSYDKLSALGHQQATWLGDHLRDSRQHHTQVYSGTLNRHVETASGMGVTNGMIQDARLNEIEYFTLAQLMEQQHGLNVPDDREGFAAHLPLVFDAWREGRIENAPESWGNFHNRVQSVLQDIATGSGPALVVTSGGWISMAMAQAMGLDTLSMARIALAIMNTSMHRLHTIGDHLCPVLFNAVPHLDNPDRHHAQTHL
ncbi:MAG: histidine phosphatase family protein [Paracoccaceae bacterium]|jgi:broad specificity phosphatase PhoE